MPDITPQPKSLRILLVADGQYSTTYAGAFHQAFIKLGHTSSYFQWKDYFHNYPYVKSQANTRWDKLKSIYYRLQNKFSFGPAVIKLNLALLKHARSFNPDIIFIYRGTHIWPCTLQHLKTNTTATIFGYNNDDPFSSKYPDYFWRHFRRGVTRYDHIFAYRAKNLADYAAMGQPNTSLLRSYFLKESNTHIIPKPTNTPYTCDVIFIGHYEADGRDEVLMHLISNGIDLKLYGTLWENSPYYQHLAAHMGGSIQPLYQANYNLAINSAQIALVFLSKLNNDSYTRRCFEIPATGTLMVSEYTTDLAENLYAPDEEAIYFTNKEDLLNKLKILLNNPRQLNIIAAAGQARLLKDGHEVTHRAQQVIKQYRKINP